MNDFAAGSIPLLETQKKKEINRKTKAPQEFKEPFIVSESMETYHEHPAISASGLKAILKSGAHYKEYLRQQEQERLEPNEKKDHFRFGTALHMALIEPKRFRENLIVRPKFDRRTKIGKIKHEQFMSASVGKTILSEEECDDLLGMIASVKQHDKAFALLKEGIPEQSLYWIDPITGVPCKSRPDFIRNSGHILDPKTIMKDKGDTQNFMREIWNREYYIQGAMQFDGCCEVLGSYFHGVSYIVIEKAPPYPCYVHALDPAAIERGTDRYREGLFYFKWCTDNDRWEGPQFNRNTKQYEVQDISLPAWTDNL